MGPLLEALYKHLVAFVSLAVFQVGSVALSGERKGPAHLAIDFRKADLMNQLVSVFLLLELHEGEVKVLEQGSLDVDLALADALFQVVRKLVGGDRHGQVSQVHGLAGLQTLHSVWLVEGHVHQAQWLHLVRAEKTLQAWGA